MSTIREITNEILKKSKHTEELETRLSNTRLIDSISGQADSSNAKVKESSEMIIALLTELKEENTARQINNMNKVNNFTYLHYNYSELISYNQAPYPMLSRFLNTYDINGEEFKPLLQRIKSNSGEELADIIFSEIVPIHNKWLDTLSNADPYLRLQLNYVPLDEVESVRNLENFGMFKSIISENNRHESYVFDASTYLLPEHHERLSKHDIVNGIFKDYKYEIPMKIDLGDGMHIASNGEEFFKTGINAQDKFVFEKLDKETPINGYMIDFRDTKGNDEKSSDVKTLLHMVFIGSVKTLGTEYMSDEEGVNFSMQYLHQKAKNVYHENFDDLSSEESFRILKSLGDDGKNEFNKNFEFSNTAKKSIQDFADKIRPDHFVYVNYLPIIHMLEKIGFENINADHLDLWCINSDASKHSPLVKTVNGLVDDYRYGRKETSELLATAKTLNNSGLLLLESKLHCCGIDPQNFQKELSKPEIKVKKYKM